MLRIALCEDNAIQRIMLHDMIEEFRASRNMNIQIDEYADGQDLIDALGTGSEYDIFLLDVLMPRLNGIETAQVLRKSGNDSRIIFISAERDYAVESYQVNAYYYLVKPVDPPVLFSLLDRCLSDEKTGITFISVSASDGIHTLPVNEILYVSSSDRRARYHLTDGSAVDSISLRTSFRVTMESLLRLRGFLLCGASLVINLAHVSEVTWGEVVLFRNGETLTLSHASASALKKALKDWSAYE